MNDLFNDLFKGKIYNDANRRTVNRMEKKINSIIDKIDYETNSDKIFLNYKIYVQVVDLLEDINQLWNSIKNHSDNMELVYHSLIHMEDIININIRHFDSSTYYDMSEDLYPKISRTIKDGKPCLHFEEIDSTSKLNADSSLGEIINVQKKKKG